MKTKIVLIGCLGKMGQKAEEILLSSGEFELYAGVDLKCAEKPYPIATRLSDFHKNADCILDFSNADGLISRLDFAVNANLAYVLGCTNLSERDFETLQKASKKIPVFYAKNFSTGIFVLKKALETIKNNYAYNDLILCETHHNTKKDSPSGTAKDLLTVLGNDTKVYSIRAGNTVGIHQVVFYGDDEMIRLTHEATDRKAFVFGALKAVKFIIGKPAKLYGMENLFSEKR